MRLWLSTNSAGYSITSGFEERVRGSHHVFRRAGVFELINLQRDGSKAKVYQVRQVRAIFTKYALGGDAPTKAEED